MILLFNSSVKKEFAKFYSTSPRAVLEPSPLEALKRPDHLTRQDTEISWHRGETEANTSKVSSRKETSETFFVLKRSDHE